ncbi:MAG: class I SAM-dependent methyltransferase [Caldilineaceae bacterium]|nr:class I SAM-dependent methyltransferase [Caldilineaceae bacterium]
MTHEKKSAHDTLSLPPGTSTVLAEILQSEEVVAGDGSCLPLRDNIPLLECLILQAWVREREPYRILEIGLAYGVSTLFLCDALTWQQGTIYHVIDPYQDRDWQSIGWLNLLRAGYADKIQFHKDTSDAVLPQLIAGGMRFDFVLIDGAHDAYQVQSDVEYAEKLLAPGGVIALDDIQLPAVQAAVDSLPRRGFQQLPVPAPYDRSRPVRLRRLNNSHLSRVVAFQHCIDSRSGETGK